MSIPQETIDQIKTDAGRAANKRDKKLREGSKDYGRRISFLDGYEEGHVAGATEWAGKAQELVDALTEIAESNCDYESTNYTKPVHSNSCRAFRAENALAKYKEVGNDR